MLQMEQNVTKRDRAATVPATEACNWMDQRTLQPHTVYIFDFHENVFYFGIW